MDLRKELRSDLDLFTEQLREFGKDVLQAEMLSRKDRLTVLHFLCQQNDENEVLKFFKLLKAEFDEDFAKMFLLNRNSPSDDRNSTFLHILPKSENITAFPKSDFANFSPINQAPKTDHSSVLPPSCMH